jgi:signal transduction histidine kinase
VDTREREAPGSEVTMDQVAIRAQEDRFLVEAANVLASSLEYQDTLAALAQLAVRSLAEFCIIDVVDDRGDIRRVQVAHTDPERAGLIADLLETPSAGERAPLSVRVLESRQPLLIPAMTEDIVESLAQQSSHREILHSLQPQSMIAVPLPTHGGHIGVAVFASSTRRYGADDVALAEKLVLLAGLELDNARHYRDARRSLEARDRVLGAVAHDLRNPLHTIVMTAGFLHDMPVSDAERKSHTEVILGTAQRMDRIIQDLLDVARIEGNHFALERADCSAGQIACEAVDLCAPAVAAKSQQVTLIVPPDAPVIHADRERLLRVLMNLLDNASKFTPQGGAIEVHVQGGPEAVKFTVTDTGPGISAEDLPHLFRPFWQATTNRAGGTGLGLAIALGIVEAHGGTMWVESVIGQGSIFHFTVPMRRI